MYVLLCNRDVRTDVYAHVGLCLVRSYQLLVKQQLLRGHHKSPPSLSAVPDIKLSATHKCTDPQIFPFPGTLPFALGTPKVSIPAAGKCCDMAGQIKRCKKIDIAQFSKKTEEFELRP